MTNDENFEHRSTVTVSVAELNNEFIRPEEVRVKIDDSVRRRPLDFGSFAYSIRSVNESYEDERCDPVVLASRIESRCTMLRYLYLALATYRSHNTILLHYRLFKYALDWCDANGHSDLFEGRSKAGDAYRGYTNHLYHQIATGVGGTSSGRDRQKCLLILIELMFPEDINHIRRSAPPIRKQVVEKDAPNEVNVLNFFNTCLAIARGIKSFLLAEESFPLVLNMPDFEVVVFPSNRGILTPIGKGKHVHCYNAKERRVATAQEFLSSYEASGSSTTGYKAACHIRSVQEALNRANEDKRYGYRVALSSLAVRAYACVFMCITGASPSEFVDFDHIESLELDKSPLKKELSAVKLRAGGKKTRYAVGRISGLGVLREYLELREWVLDGRTHEKLFFEFNRVAGKYTGILGRLPTSYVRKFYLRIVNTYLDESCPNVTTASIRKFKSEILHAARESPDVVADVLSHTLSTNLVSYAVTTGTKRQKEFESYWSSVKKAAERACRTVGSEDKSIPTGHCASFDNPLVTELITVSPAIQPDCRAQYGCLYCANYVCHADEMDIHKLLSLRYVIEAIRESFPDMAHADQLFKDLCMRISYIIEHVSQLSQDTAELVLVVKKRTYGRGMLTPFWERRLQRYESLGVVF